MGVPQGRDDVFAPLLGEDRLEPKLVDALLPPTLTDGRAGFPAREERARSSCVPRAALVIADPPRAGGEQGVPHVVQRLARNEHDELLIQSEILMGIGSAGFGP
jgi:hypothetical protein